jgi:putative addiction module component (TIGR02574 family)
LPVAEREALAQRLMRSVDDLPPTAVDEAWVAEAERRFTAWRKGERKAVPAARALRELRKAVRR